MSDAKFVEAGQREMVKSDLMGGTIHVNNATYDCTVGTFEKRDMFRADGGGITPMTVGDCQVVAADLPVNFNFSLGLKLTVIPNTGKLRECQVHSSQHSGPLINLLLRDVNEKA